MHQWHDVEAASSDFWTLMRWLVPQAVAEPFRELCTQVLESTAAAAPTVVVVVSSEQAAALLVFCVLKQVKKNSFVS